MSDTDTVEETPELTEQQQRNAEIKEEMAQFGAWLSDGGKSAYTVRTYVSHARSALRAGIDLADEEAFMAWVEDHSTNSHGPRKVARRRYLVFERGGTPDEPFAPKKVAVEDTDDEDSVAA